MAQAGYTPISLYYSTTPTLAPAAGNLVPGELALNTVDGKLYYKNNSGIVTLLASAGSALATVQSVSVTTGNGFSGTVANTTTTPAITVGTTVTGLLKGNGTAVSAASSGVDYAPATSGTSILYGNGSGAFSNVTVGAGLTFIGGTLTVAGGGAGVVSFSAGTTGLTPSTDTTGAITLAGTLATTNGGTGLTSFTANRVFYASSSSTIGSSANLTFNGTYLTVKDVRIGGSAGTGINNIAIGESVLNVNTTGSSNVALGNYSLQANTTGANNVAIGYSALQNNTINGSNIAIGSTALYTNTTGSQNTAVGGLAMFYNTTGSYNTAVGTLALTDNTTGVNNVAMGQAALGNNTSGAYNVGLGDNSLFNTLTSDSNASVGFQSLYNNTAGTNTAIGRAAGFTNTTGSNNTFIGYDSAGATATTSNNITLGNGSITALRCQVTTITALSDERDKTNIKDIPAGLNFIEELRPVSFDWNTRDGAKVGIPEFGFIAQELQKAQKNTGIKVPNLVFEENPEKLEAGMGALLPVLVKAIQELNEKVKLLESKL